MISKETINTVVSRLVETYNPVEIYIFGSYAWGHPDEESDLDVAVVIDEYTQDPHVTLVEGYRALRGLRLSKEILVFSKQEFGSLSEDPARFCFKIKHDGKKVYARS